jgi:quercetin dioxygenase-like cupin family protein/DNA-binding XRE family transcriptional regulator
MTDQIKLIADRIRELREISGISVETLANELGVANDLFLKYEGGSIDIPVSFLFKIAHKFDMELSALLGGDEPKLHVYSVVRKGKGLKVQRSKQYKYESLAYKFIHKKAEPFMVTVEPSTDDSLEFNSHPGQEFNFVIEGTMKIIVDSHEIILQEGDSIYFDSGYKHAMKAMNNKTVKFIAVAI